MKSCVPETLRPPHTSQTRMALFFAKIRSLFLLHNPVGGIKFHFYPKPHLVWVPHAQHGVLYSGYAPRWRCQREVERHRDVDAKVVSVMLG